ncbi:MAG: hypothetical protein ABW055_06150 [Pararhizobium sp.]
MSVISNNIFPEGMRRRSSGSGFATGIAVAENKKSPEPREAVFGARLPSASNAMCRSHATIRTDFGQFHFCSFSIHPSFVSWMERDEPDRRSVGSSSRARRAVA